MSREHKKIERLLLFSEVAKNLNFTVSAKALGISKGYLSEQIKRLEQEMGSPLLLRSTRSVRLTEAGEKVLNGMENIRSNLLELERNVNESSCAFEGSIRITSPNQFTDGHLLDICHAFQQLHPKIKFLIDCSYTNHDLSKSNFDLAFRSTNNPPNNMIAKSIYRYQHWTCASPLYLNKNSHPSSINELKNHQCLHGIEQSNWKYKNGDIEISGWLIINDNNMLKREALRGNGIIRVPQYFVEKEVRLGKLEKILTDEYVDIGGEIQIIYPQLIQQSARLKAFIQFTVEWFNS